MFWLLIRVFPVCQCNCKECRQVDFPSPADVVYPKQKSSFTENATFVDITVASCRQI